MFPACWGSQCPAKEDLFQGNCCLSTYCLRQAQTQVFCGGYVVHLSPSAPVAAEPGELIYTLHSYVIFHLSISKHFRDIKTHSCGASWGEAVINVAREMEAQILGASANVFNSGDSHLYTA